MLSSRSGILTHVAHTVRSSAYKIRFTGSVGLGISVMQQLNIDGDGFEPCGTPVLTFLDVDLTALKRILTCLPLR